jgi:endonuclease/exonuclease/phosphatase family metal-dependent hydrolase
MGDFNTVGDQAQLDNEKSAYHLMTGNFRDARPESLFSDLWTSFGKGPGGTSEQVVPDGGRRIDYIFMLNPRSESAMKLQTQEIAVNRFLDSKVIALSDHSAVEATFKIEVGQLNPPAK